MTSVVEMGQMAAFIDTSMGTRMAVPFYPNITTGDFKREFEREHFNYFPELGQIMVNSLTVKRKSHCYHLPESASMKHFYDAFKGKLFLHADACLLCSYSSGERKGTNYCDAKNNRLAENNSIDCAVAEQAKPAGVTDIEKNGFFSPDCEVKTTEKTNSDSNGSLSSEVISVTSIINKYFYEEVQNTFDDASKLPKYGMGNLELKKQVRNLEMKKRRVRNLKTKKCGIRLEPNVVTPSNKPHGPSLGNMDYGILNDKDSNRSSVWKRILVASVKLGLPGSSNQERPFRNLVFEISDGED